MKLIYGILLLTLPCLILSLRRSSRRPFDESRPGRFYVDPKKGSDEYSGKYPEVKRVWSGGWKKDGPYATIKGALKQIGIRRRHGEYASVEVYLRAGMYRVDEPIPLNEKDKSTKITNYKKETVIIQGSRNIPGNTFQPLTETDEYTIFSAPYTGSCSMNANLAHKRLIRARKPNVEKWTGENFSGEGPYLTIADVMYPSSSCDRQNSGGFKQDCPEGNRDGFVFHRKDISQSGRNRKSEMDVVLFQAWTAERGRVGQVHKNNNTVVFAEPVKYKIGEYPVSSGWRYILENAFSEIDAPGEFYCNEKKRRFYVALPKSAHKTLQRKGIEVPVLGKFFVVKDTDDIKFGGLHFKLSDSNGQGYLGSPGTITIQNSTNIHIYGCTFEDMGHVGIYASETRNLLVEKNYFRRIGYIGVSVDYYNDPLRETATRNIFITRNTMTQCGMINMFQPACIHVRGARNIQILNNHIFNTAYSAIRAGWQEAFTRDYVDEGEHVFTIERNHLHDFGQGLLNDFGAIYLATNQKKCKDEQRAEVCHLHAIVKNNVIHDSRPYLYGGTGVHGDTAVSSWSIEDNWIYRVHDAAAIYHCGINNYFLNNVIYYTGQGNRVIGTCNNAMLGLNGAQPRMELTAIGNVFYIENSKITMWKKRDTWDNDPPFFENNLYYFPLNWSNQTSIFFPKGLSFEEWQAAGQDRNSIIADPEFVNVSKDNYRLSGSSPMAGYSVGRLNLIPVRDSSGVPKPLRQVPSKIPKRPKK